LLDGRCQGVQGALPVGSVKGPRRQVIEQTADPLGLVVQLLQVRPAPVTLIDMGFDSPLLVGVQRTIQVRYQPAL
jgi:hypothetical protein